MDRSFLSDPEVVKASRDFVCARLLTYESAEEGKFLETMFTGREGTLENTVYVVLAPDGKTKLTRAGRTPRMIYGGSTEADIAEMADALRKIAKDAKPADGAREIPFVEDLRVALNVAACDGQALVAVVGKGEELEKELAKLAWSEGFIGKFIYVRVPDPAALKVVKGAKAEAGLLVVAPGTYGLDGTALAQGTTDAAALLRKGAESFVPEKKEERKHIEEGRRRGIEWETEIPVTDPGPPGPRGR
jgi:hypothetical protein